MQHEHPKPTKGTMQMAQKVEVELVDDLDGGPATETVEFAIDGVTYEIDLSGENADTLRETLAQYVDAGRRTGGRKRKSSGGGAGATSTARAEAQEQRQWAKANGYKVSERGRVPADIVAKWREDKAAKAKAKAAESDAPKQTAPAPAAADAVRAAATANAQTAKPATGTTAPTPTPNTAQPGAKTTPPNPAFRGAGA